MRSLLKSRSLFSVAALALALTLFALPGCSNNGKTQLQGEVTYGGQPIALGTITFTPKAEGYRAVQTITDGKFDIPEKYGVQPGEYNVAIEGYVKAPEDDPDQQAEKSFPDYQTSYTVVAGQPMKIDVPESGK